MDQLNSLVNRYVQIHFRDVLYLGKVKEVDEQFICLRPWTIGSYDYDVAQARAQNLEKPRSEPDKSPRILIPLRGIGPIEEIVLDSSF